MTTTKLRKWDRVLYSYNNDRGYTRQSEGYLVSSAAEGKQVKIRPFRWVPWGANWVPREWIVGVISNQLDW